MKIFKRDQGEYIVQPVHLVESLLNSMSVAGVFKFTPKFLIESGVTFGSKEEVQFTYGYDEKIKFNFGLYSNQGLLKKPEFWHQLSSDLKEHQYTATKDIQLTASAHFRRDFEMSLEIFGSTQHMKFSVDSQYGLQISTGKLQKCPENLLQAQIFRQNLGSYSITNRMGNMVSDVWDSGQKEMACFFCKKCFPGIKSKGKTPTLDAPTAQVAEQEIEVAIEAADTTIDSQ